ncbi:MAG: DMT family transporter [Rhizobiaceae bacterium]|nr:DMT family transporter [Rhizobiaceae bacterium]
MADRRPPIPTRLGLSAAGALALLVVGAMAMGISPVFVRHSEVGPFASAFWRVALALPVLIVWALATRDSAAAPFLSRIRHRGVVLSGLFFTGDLIFWHLAIVNTSIANATFFACLAPIWVALLSRFAIGEAVSRQTFLGLALSVPGAALLILHSAGGGGNGSHWLGDLYGLATSFFFGLYFLAVRDARRHLNAGETTFVSSLVTAAFLLLAALLSGEDFLPETLAGASNLLALGLVSHAGGQGLLTVALGVLSASFSSLVIFIEAVAAALFGWIFADETPGLLQVLGGVLILGGIWIARPRPAPLL